MKKIYAFFKYFIDRPWIIILILTIFALAMHLYHLGQIKDQIFDEVYFVTFAKNYLSGTKFFDIHPPLGKLIIASGIKIFGDTQFGWRIMPAIFGTLLIPLIYLTAKEIGGKIVGILAAVIISLDGMVLVYSRVGLIDIFMSFFIILTFYLFLKFINTQKLSYLFLTSLSFAFSASIKYIGALIILVLIATAIIKKVPLKKYLIYYILFSIIVPIIIYLAFFVFNFPILPIKSFFGQVIEWHRQSLNYNLHLTATHPYGSKWWTWFLLLRPIWLYFKDNGGYYTGVDGIGNPLIWWSSILVVPLLLWGVIKKDKNALIILSGFLILWLPWAFVKRVVFFYHALPAFMFLVIGTGYLLKDLLIDKMGKILLAAYYAVMIFFFVFFLPIWIGTPIASAKFYLRMWLKGWI